MFLGALDTSIVVAFPGAASETQAPFVASRYADRGGVRLTAKSTELIAHDQHGPLRECQHIPEVKFAQWKLFAVYAGQRRAE